MGGNARGWWLFWALVFLVLTPIVHGHASNWAVLVCTSKFWFNYRHMANTLSLYRTVKRLGIPDSNIILMLADEVVCNPRNSFPGQIFNSAHSKVDLYGSSVEVDYRGVEVTVENFVRVLTGRHDAAVPRSKRMFPDRDSNVFVFLSGHGGNQFLKFQDTEELMAQDIADVVAQMHEKGRYKELLLIVESCQAATMYSRIHSPNVLGISSSRKGESSYSHHNDLELGVTVIDRFTYATLDFFERVDIYSNATFVEYLKTFKYEDLHSHLDFRKDLYGRELNEVPLTDFFGSISQVKTTNQGYPLGKGEEHPHKEPASADISGEQVSTTDVRNPTQGTIPQSEDYDGVVLLGLLLLLAAVAFSSKL